MSIRLLAALATALTLAGCAALAPPKPVAVQVPIATPCLRVADLPAWPLLIAGSVWDRTTDPFERTRALLADRLLLLAHAERQEALLRACAE